MTIQSGREAIEAIENMMKVHGFRQWDNSFSFDGASDAILHKLFRVQPASMVPEAAGRLASDELRLFNVFVLFLAESFDVSSEFRNTVMADEELLVDVFDSMPDVENVESLYDPSEDGRAVVLQFNITMRYCRPRVPLG